MKFRIIFFYSLLFLFIYVLWLQWVFVAALGLSLVAASRGYSLNCGAWTSVVVAHELSSSAACGIIPDRGSNWRPLCVARQILNHWTAREALKHILLRFNLPTQKCTCVRHIGQ